MELRTFKDKDGIHIELLHLNLSYIYEGLIEGSRSGAHEVFRQDIARELSANKALYIVGFSEPDEQVEKRWADLEKWPPGELVIVRCRSKWVPPGKHPHGHTSLTIKWYQDGGDPFEFLSKVLMRISWQAYAKYVPLVD